MSLSRNKQRGRSEWQTRHFVLQQSSSTHNKQQTQLSAVPPQIRSPRIAHDGMLMYHNDVNCWSAETWEGRSTHLLLHPPTNSAGFGRRTHGPCLVAQGACGFTTCYMEQTGVPSPLHVRHYLPASRLPAPTNLFF